MTGPRIYKAINAVMADFAKDGIAKAHTNAHDQYRYRSIDDILNRLAPLLAKHRLCVLPRVLERISADRSSASDEILVNVVLRVAFDLVCAHDQSRHTVEAFGEALDGGDKATAKALSAAYKSAMLQTFCIPVAGNEDADGRSHKLRKTGHVPQPVQGWEQWSKDVADVIAACETEEALTRVQDTNRTALNAICRERSDLYAAIGEAFALRRSALAAWSTPASPVAATKLNGSNQSNDVKAA